MSEQARPLFGALIGVVFGVVFFLANAGPFGTPWSIVVRVIGVAIGIALLVPILRARRGIEVAPDELGFGRGYWIIVLIEVVALVAGVFVCNRVLHHPEAGVAWVAIVVGVHFLALAQIWTAGLFTILGGVMTLLGVVGVLLAVTTGSAAAVAAVAGIGSGLALFAASATVLRPSIPG